MKYIAIFLISFTALALCGCGTTKEKKRLPSRETDHSELPWDRPASWEGGLPGMGGVGTPTRY